MKPDLPNEDVLGAELYVEALLGRLPSVPRPGRDLEGPLKREFFATLRLTPDHRCFAPEDPPCLATPVNAHSIQRGSVLRFLAGASGHVVTFEAVPCRDAQRTTATTKTVGIQQASTFRGMCAQHDSKLFSPIDTDVIRRPTSEQLVLLAYRAALKQHHQEWRDLTWSEALERSADALDMHPAFVRAFFRNCTNDVRRCFEAGKPALKRLHTSVRQRRAGRNLISIHRFVRPLSFATSAMFSPLTDFRGRFIWGTEQPSAAFLHVLPTSQGTLIALSVDRRSRLKLRDFLADFGSADDEQQIEMAWQLALSWTNNTFVSQAAWAQLGEAVQHHTLDYWMATHGLQQPPWPGLPVPEATL